jgi:hypothetical protein
MCCGRRWVLWLWLPLLLACMRCGLPLLGARLSGDGHS